MGRLDHVNIAAEDAAAMAGIFRDVIGLDVVAEDVVPGQGVKVVKLGAGDTVVEITEPLGPDTPVGRYLAKRGQGIHHLAFEVDDLGQFANHLEKLGIEYSDGPHVKEDGSGFAFIDAPEGYEIELMQRGRQGEGY